MRQGTQGNQELLPLAAVEPHEQQRDDPRQGPVQAPGAGRRDVRRARRLSGTGTFTVFKVGDLIEIDGTQGGLNNGDRTVLTVAAGSITCDFPFHSEGPTAGVEVRTQ